jgi:hypothetical protein
VVNTIERKAMKITSISKAAIAVGINALVLSGLVAGPASADPPAGVYADLVGTGSDTTQDIMNGLSAAIGVNPDTDNRYIASYDAAPGDMLAADCQTDDDKITPQEGGLTFTRPNGSSNGRDTLRASIGQSSSVSVRSYACGLVPSSDVNYVTLSANQTLTAAVHQGVTQFARSSSTPPADQTNTAGVLAYVPFAKDAMTIAVSPTTKIPALTFGTSSVDTEFGDVVGKVEPTLYALYTCKVTQVIEPSVGASFLANDDYVEVAGDEATPINVYIPQAGSGTRAFWIAKFNVTESNISGGAANASCLDDTIDGGDNNGVAVQEHSGLAVGSDDYGVTPHSIPTYVAQNNGVEGVTSRINGSVLHPIGGINPTNGTGTSKVLNPTYLTSSNTSMLSRLMYNIVPSRTLDDPSSLENEVFAGTSSLLCSETATITEYGYGLLTASTGSSSCGYTGLRAYTASSTSFTIDVVDAESATANTVTAAAEGDTVYFRVKLLTTTGNGGGTVQLNDGAGNTFAEFEIDPGAAITSTNTTWQYFEVTLDENLPAGGYLVDAVFVPTLPGAATATTAGLISFSLDQREIDGMTLELYASTYKVGKKGKLGVEVEYTGVYPTGTLTVKNGNKVLGSASVAGYEGGAGGNIAQRELADTLVNFSKKFTKKGRVTLTIEYSGDDTYLPYSMTQLINVKK